jgi:hypothetical protein
MSRLSEELVLSGTYYCIGKGYNPLLTVETWILATVWEVLVLCLTIWIAVIHLRERRSKRSTIGNYLVVLAKYQVFYFAG